jgi:hypothetical protein
MKKLLLSGVAALFLATGTAHHDHDPLGDPRDVGKHRIRHFRWWC